MEYNHYQELSDRVDVARGGTPPLAMSGDRGLAYDKVYLINTRKGTATVVPFRARGSKTKQEQVRTDSVDENNVIRCSFCGGECEQVTFYFDTRKSPSEPRIRYRCLEQALPECAKEYSISCLENPSLLVPLPQTDPLYHDIQHLHQSGAEAPHADWRARYKVFEDGIKRLSVVPVQALRAEAARFVEWFKIGLRQGFIKGHAILNEGKPFSRRNCGKLSYKRLLLKRRKKNLDLPYGPAAEKLGLARAGPSASSDPPAQAEP